LPTPRRQEEGSGQVRPENGLPVGQGRLEQRNLLLYAGVAHEQVHPTEGLGLSDHVPDVGFITHIGLHGDRPCVVGLLDVANDILSCLLLLVRVIVHADARTLTVQSLCGGLADAARGAGHDRLSAV
jgi:hypothetical protein